LAYTEDNVTKTLRQILNDIERLRRELTGYIINGEAHRVIADIAVRIEELSLSIPTYSDVLSGLSRRLKLLSTLAQALHNQWKHVHSKRALGRVNYLDQHLSEVEGILRDLEEKIKSGSIDKTEIKVIRRIVF